MKKLVMLAISSGVILFSECTPKKATTGAMSAEAKVSEVKKNYTEAQMEEGKTLWQGACGKCHKLYNPEDITVEKWENVLPRMAKRSKFDDEQTGKVRAYLLTHAKQS